MPGVTLTPTCERGALGLVLEAGAAHGAAAGTDEREAGHLDGLHQLLVLGHEAVAGEDRVVAVVLRDRDDLADALRALLLGGARVVRHAVHATGIGQRAQLGRQRVGEDDGVLLREQDAVAVDAHLVEDVHGLAPDRAAADDERAHVLAGEAAYPARGVLGQPAVAMHQGIVQVVVVAAAHCFVFREDGWKVAQWNSRWTPANGSGV